MINRARVVQIMDLLMLAPDIQEALLFLPPVRKGRDPINEYVQSLQGVTGHANTKTGNIFDTTTISSD